MNEEQHTTVDEIKSTVVAFSDWLDINSDCYIMLITRGEDSILAAKGKHDELCKSLVSGMMGDERVESLIMEAAKTIMGKKLFDMLKDKNK